MYRTPAGRSLPRKRRAAVRAWKDDGTIATLVAPLPNPTVTYSNDSKFLRTNEIAQYNFKQK